jgi:ParB-like chromosome segregation protein Spo0J
MTPNTNVTITAAATASGTEERIGKYRVHPVASMFPLMDGEDYEDLRKSIEKYGQLEPIVLDSDNVLLDGRNRMRVLLELGRQPFLHLHTGKMSVEQYILARNLFRRHLTDDQRMMITTKVMLAKEAEAARARKKEGGSKHGRSHPKKVAANSTQAIREPTVTEKIADLAKGTDYQARQAVGIVRDAPELVEPVVTGAMKLKDAAKKVKAAAPEHPVKRSEPNYMDAKTRAIGRLQDAMRDLNNVYKAYPTKQEDLCEVVEKLMAFALPPFSTTIVFGTDLRKATRAKPR